MRTKLAFIAVSGFAVSAVCLGGAFALGGGIVGNTDFDFGGFDLPRCDTMDQSAGTATSRTLPWEGSDDRAAVAIPANTHYQAGIGDQLVVKGDPEILTHIRVRDGVVKLDCHGHFNLGKDNRIDVTLPGRHTFRSFDLMGSGDMQLKDLSQPEVKISVSGSGNIEASGKIDNLKLDVSGSGNLKLGDLVAKNVDADISGSGHMQLAGLSQAAVQIAVSGDGDVEADGKTDYLKADVSGSGDLKLGNLVVKNADVDISGSGKVVIAPQETLNADISGSGDIYLRSEPKKLETTIRGSGRIVHAKSASWDRPRGRHARWERDDIRVAVETGLANDRVSDHDELERAKARLTARIRSQVATELAGN